MDDKKIISQHTKRHMYKEKLEQPNSRSSSKKCHEIDVLQRRFDEFSVNNEVREITGKLKKKTYEL